MSRSVRYIKAKNFDPKASSKVRESVAKKLMNERRTTLARLSAEALNALTEQQKQAWSDLQGKPFQFKSWEEPGHIIFSYR